MEKLIEKLFGFFVVFVFGLFIFTMGMFVYSLVVGDKEDCKIYGQQTKRTVEYVNGTCYVEYKNIKIPYEEFIARTVTNEK